MFFWFSWYFYVISKYVDWKLASVNSYSPSCRSKPVRPSFIFGTQIKIFLIKSESNATDTLKAQEGSKDIVKIVHLTSVVQP